jgi:prepilin-type N-terminal cleavage/methylation domain-containing protein
MIASSPRFRSTRRGYTAVEVMLAMTVLLIGSAGVMTMQKASIQSNLDARKLDIANSIAHDWLERLSADATQWTLPTIPTNLSSNLGNTTWLNRHDTGWFLPSVPGGYPAAEGNSPAFDILGRDLALADAPNAIFCVHVKLDQIAQDALALPLLLRATVVVFWRKQLVTSTSTATSGSNCTSASNSFDPALDESNNPGTWHIIYATTAIRKSAPL